MNAQLSNFKARLIPNTAHAHIYLFIFFSIYSITMVHRRVISHVFSRVVLYVIQRDNVSCPKLYIFFLSTLQNVVLIFFYFC